MGANFGMNTESPSEEHTFQHVRSLLIKLLDQAEAINRDTELSARIEAARKRLSHEKLNILVVGEFSRGKSTFLNTLLGKSVLPSDVNPTTATINLIEAGEPAQMKLRYRTGEEEQAALPETGINKFLRAYVTTANQRAQAIETIRITVPGRLEKWQCILVDTPGVNDLDDMREEITFRFLSQADACIVVLDGQQPLSESERRFLRDRVLGRDVSRLFFVVNRMDEIPRPGSDPSQDQNERIRRYVEGRLQENLEQLGQVQIHTVASKPVLGSRVKGEPSAWDSVFEEMEEDLLRFVGENANNNRIPDHLDRASQISQDLQTVLANQLRVIGQTDQELKARLDDVKRQSELAQAGMEGVQAVVLDEKQALVRKLRASMNEGLTSLKSTLLEQAKTATDDGDLLMIKSTLSRGLGDLVADLEVRVGDWRDELFARLLREFSNVFEPNALGSSGSVQGMQQTSVADNIELAKFSDSEVREASFQDYLKVFGASFGTGATVGLVGSFLFGGPVLIAAGAIGGWFVGQQFDKQRIKKERERIQAETQKNISRQLNDFLDSSAGRAAELAEKAGSQVSTEIDELVSARRSMMDSLIRAQQEEITHEVDDTVQRGQELQHRLNQCELLIEELAKLQGGRG